MDFAAQQRNSGKHAVGFAIVLLLHLLLGWALVNGLAQRIVEVIKSPLETKVIEEAKPPPPPPENLPPPPKTPPPPPSFVPPPEVNVAAPPTPGPTITITHTAPPPTPVTVAPPPPPAPPPPVVARAPVRTEPRIDFSSKCERPEYNAAARRAEAQGSTVIVFTMDTSGVINEASVEKSSGPTREHRMLDRLALEAVKACRGTPGTLDGKPEKLTSRVQYDWKITD